MTMRSGNNAGRNCEIAVGRMRTGLSAAGQRAAAFGAAHAPRVDAIRCRKSPAPAGPRSQTSALPCSGQRATCRREHSRRRRTGTPRACRGWAATRASACSAHASARTCSALNKAPGWSATAKQREAFGGFAQPGLGRKGLLDTGDHEEPRVVLHVCLDAQA